MAKGIGRGLGIEDEVTSPTFTVLSEYEGRLRLHHMDAYRLLGPEDFAEMGGEEILADPGGLSLIEWSERIGAALPSSAESIELRVKADGSRLALVEGRILESIAVEFAERTAGGDEAPGQGAASQRAASREDGR